MIIAGVAASVVLVLVVGLAVGRRVHGSSTNFLVAGRALALPLVAAALMGQAVDSNATLGNTDLAGTFGLGFWAGASLPLGLALCLLITGLVFARRMNAMKLFTLADFYRLRYGRRIEVVAGVLMIFSFVILLAGNLVAGGVIFEAFLGVPYWVGVLVLVAVVLSYTIVGGMISDAYTALIQMAITVVAIAALVVWVGTEFGFSVPAGQGPFDLGQLGDPAQGAVINWANLIALGIGDIVAIDFMQRIFSARSPDTARRACLIAAALTASVGVAYTMVALSVPAILGGEVGDSGLLTLLDTLAPGWLAILVLSGIVAASCSTANGAILGTSAIATRNLADIKIQEDAHGHDTLLRWTRYTMVPVVGLAILLALAADGQTAVLLVLAFDFMLACLVIPFAAGHFWPRANATAAGVSLAVGFVVRAALFVVTPTCYGLPNDILYIENDVVSASFDGWPTFIAFGVSIVTFVVTALVTGRPDRTVVLPDGEALAQVTAPRTGRRAAEPA